MQGEQAGMGWQRATVALLFLILLEARGLGQEEYRVVGSNPQVHIAEEVYYLATGDEPLVIEVKGPGTLSVSLRQNLVPGAQAPFPIMEVHILQDGKEIKYLRVIKGPAVGFHFDETDRYLPSQELMLPLDVPLGSHRYTFKVEGNTIFGGSVGLTFVSAEDQIEVSDLEYPAAVLLPPGMREGLVEPTRPVAPPVVVPPVTPPVVAVAPQAKPAVEVVGGLMVPGRRGRWGRPEPSFQPSGPGLTLVVGQVTPLFVVAGSTTAIVCAEYTHGLAYGFSVHGGLSFYRSVADLGDGGVRLTYLTMPIMAGVTFRPLATRLSPFIGASLGVMALGSGATLYNSSGQEAASEGGWSAAFAYSFRAGLDANVGPGYILLEVRLLGSPPLRLDMGEAIIIDELLLTSITTEIGYRFVF